MQKTRSQSTVFLSEYIRTIDKKLIPRLVDIQDKIEDLVEEWEVISNPELLKDIEESLEQKKKGKLYDWEKFEKIVEAK